MLCFGEVLGHRVYTLGLQNRLILGDPPPKNYTLVYLSSSKSPPGRLWRGWTTTTIEGASHNQPRPFGSCEMLLKASGEACELERKFTEALRKEPSGRPRGRLSGEPLKPLGSL